MFCISLLKIKGKIEIITTKNGFGFWLNFYEQLSLKSCLFNNMKSNIVSQVAWGLRQGFIYNRANIAWDGADEGEQLNTVWDKLC